MINIANIKLADIMPANLLTDDNVKAAAEAIDKELAKVTLLIKEDLIISRIDELSEDLIDLLAQQWHVDFYDDTLPIETKRNLVRKSIDWHKHKGTPYAVKEVVAAILEGAEVLENWQYGGNAYNFKVSMIGGDLPDEQTLQKLISAVNQTKNTRSHLDGIGFIRYLFHKPYFAAGTGEFRLQKIGMSKFVMPDLQDNQYFTAGNGILKEVYIPWQTGQG